MTTYNSSIFYDNQLVTYAGIVLVIQETIVVNSETVSTLQIVDVPVYASLEMSVVDQAAYAISTIINQLNNPDAGLSISVDKENSHAVISAGKDPEADAAITITIISNV